MAREFARHQRLGNEVLRTLSELLRFETKDPRLHSVTVTWVDITDDLRLARIYVTTGQPGQDEAEVMSGVTKATGFIRAELGRRLSLRYNPELVFLKDTSGPRGDRILSLLESLKTDSYHERHDDSVPTKNESES